MIPKALEPNTQVGRYRVVGPIGRGGMGGVFEVEDETGKRFAMKSPLHDITTLGDVTQRFAREANALRMLDHPNLVSAVDVFVEGGQLYLVMEKVDGRSLAKAIAGGPIPPRQTLVLARQILEGVAHAHKQGIVHRDLKPENVMLCDMGGWEKVKIIDFGLVKLVGDAADAFGANALTRTGLVFGTPLYMAPEQALGRLVDGRADLYAIGIMIYEMLAGHPPFRDNDPYVVMKMHAKSPLPSLRAITNEAAWCTHAVVGLVEGALRKDPAQRYSSAPLMIAVLDAAFASLDHVTA